MHSQPADVHAQGGMLRMQPSTSILGAESITTVFEAIDNMEKEQSQIAESAGPQNEQPTADDNPDGAATRQHYIYTLERTFETEELCDQFIKNEKCWTKLRPALTLNGLKTIYRCNLVKYRGKQCDASIYTLSKKAPNDTTHELYRREKQHTHDDSPNKITTLSESVKELLNEYIEKGVTLKPILHELRKKQIDLQPMKHQVANYIRTARKKFYGKAKVSVEDIIQHCQRFAKIPDDIDEAFILGYEHSPIENNYDMTDEELQTDIFQVIDQHLEAEQGDCDPQEEDERPAYVPWVRFFVTTKRLLQNASESKIICADSTKKMVVQRYPVLVFGTTDNDTIQHFHLIGIMVSTFEKTEDFAFAFKTIQTGMDRVFSIDYLPDELMADAAGAIHKGFKRVFGENKTVLMCYPHVMRAIDRRKCANPASKEKIKQDIRVLHLCYSKEMFERGCELFVAKWQNTEREFVKYFSDYWTSQNSNWYNGAAIRKPSSNNGLESFNGSLKIHHTHFQIVGLAVFKVKLMDIVSNRSKEYMMDKNPFQFEVVIPKKTLEEGYKMLQTHAFISKRVDDKAIFYVAKKETLTQEYVDQYVSYQHENFDDFAQHLFDVIIVSFNAIVEGWRNTASCSCSSFADNFTCKHVVFVAYKLNLLTHSEEHVLSSNTKPGRPSKAGPALQIE